MIPSPFVSEDYLRSRLALPFHNPLVKPFQKIGINPRDSMFPIELQPISNVKGYFLGGLLATDADLKAFAEKAKQEKTPAQRLDEWGNNNPSFVWALAALLK
jgi:hypothetical protein